MFYETGKIEFGGVKYPIKCTISVLAKIQKEYGTLDNFVNQLLGIKDGENKSEPSAAVIEFTLPKMIRAGLEIEAKEKGVTERATEQEIANMLDKNIYELANITYRTYLESFKMEKK